MLEWQERFWGHFWLAILSDENPQGTPGPFTGQQGWATAAKTSLLKWIRVFFKRSENFKCRHLYSLELISWGPHSSLERERKRKIRRRLFTSSIKQKIKHFHVLISRAETEEKCTKKAWCTCKVVVLLKNPFACLFLSLAGKIKIQTVVNT